MSTYNCLFTKILSKKIKNFVILIKKLFYKFYKNFYLETKNIINVEVANELDLVSKKIINILNEKNQI